MKSISENIHWQNFLNGDKDAFTLLYEETVSDLFNYGKGMGFDSEICRDGIHDVFYTLYIRKNDFRNISNIRFYLLRSLKNRLLDSYKKNKNLHEWNSEHGTPPFLIEVSVSEKMEQEEEQILLKQKVEKLLDTLTDRQREAVYLRFMQEMEYQEIGSILNMNPESVRKLIFRAIQAIRKLHKILLFIYY